MSNIELKAYDILKAHFKNDEEARVIIELIEEKKDKKATEGYKNLATKTDLAEIRTEITEVKSDILKWIFGVFITLSLMILGLYLKK